MNCAELLLHLYGLGGRVWLENDRVRVRAPRGMLSAELRQELGLRKNEIRQWLQRLGAREAPRAALVRQVRPERLPLSYAQQRLWFLYWMEGPSATYNIPLALRLEGELDLVAMQAAMVDVVARQEGLRTVFPEQDGVPFQHILAAEQAAPVVITETLSEAELPERLAQAAITGIELSRELPLRA